MDDEIDDQILYEDLSYPEKNDLENCSCTVEEALNCPYLKDCKNIVNIVERYNDIIKQKEIDLPTHLLSNDKIDAPLNSKVSPKNKLNNLTGGEWLYHTKALITTSFPERWAFNLRKEHGANKPPDLMRYLIEFFTKAGETVLDPFAGVGGTLLGASICSQPRKAIGIEISKKWVDIYKKSIKAIRMEGLNIIEQSMIQGDSLKILKDIRLFRENSIDFIITDPPYNIQLEKTMVTGKYPERKNRQSNYNMITEDEHDLSNLNSYEDFLDKLQEVFSDCFKILKNKKYFVVILRDAYQNGEFIMTSNDVLKICKEIGLIPKGNIIWYQNGSKLRPYGYPFAFVPNIVYQNILIFQKKLN